MTSQCTCRASIPTFNIATANRNKYQVAVHTTTMEELEDFGMTKGIIALLVENEIETIAQLWMAIGTGKLMRISRMGRRQIAVISNALNRLHATTLEYIRKENIKYEDYAARDIGISDTNITLRNIFSPFDTTQSSLTK